MHRRNGRAGQKGAGIGVGPLWKTFLCREFPHGRCRFSIMDCSFAHGEDDLRPSPDMTRTSVCPIMLKRGVCTKPGCRYAHDSTELRQDDRILKTQLCKFFMSEGGCIVGKACRFAHGPHELCASEADVKRKHIREAFLKSAGRTAETAEPAQIVKPSASPPYAFAGPTLVRGPILVSQDVLAYMPFMQHSGSGLPSGSMSDPVSVRHPGAATFQRRRQAGAKSQRKSADGSPVTARTNVERIRAAMSTGLLAAAPSTSARKESDASTDSGDSSQPTWDPVVKNTFVDFESTHVEPPARSKSV